MMRVTVKLFGTFRQAAGWAKQELELADGATVAGLLITLAGQDARTDFTNHAVYAAVNQAYAHLDDPLHDGDEVALFPPVSGGQAHMITVR